jgi:ssDNA-binding Zn-finger/Zn-ribbon topoisomerase 1
MAADEHDESELPRCPKCGGETQLGYSRHGALCLCLKYPLCEGFVKYTLPPPGPEMKWREPKWN